MGQAFSRTQACNYPFCTCNDCYTKKKQKDDEFRKSVLDILTSSTSVTDYIRGTYDMLFAVERRRISFVNKTVDLSEKELLDIIMECPIFKGTTLEQIGSPQIDGTTLTNKQKKVFFGKITLEYKYVNSPGFEDVRVFASFIIHERGDIYLGISRKKACEDSHNGNSYYACNTCTIYNEQSDIDFRKTLLFELFPMSYDDEYQLVIYDMLCKVNRHRIEIPDKLDSINQEELRQIIMEHLNFENEIPEKAYCTGINRKSFIFNDVIKQDVLKKIYSGNITLEYNCESCPIVMATFIVPEKGDVYLGLSFTHKGDRGRFERSLKKV